MDEDSASAGRRRQQPSPDKIARRVARLARSPRAPRGVMALNPGFFLLERMRAGNVAKRRGVTKRRVK